MRESEQRAAALLAIMVLQRKTIEPMWDELAWQVLGTDPLKPCTCTSGVPDSRGCVIDSSFCQRHYGSKW